MRRLSDIRGEDALDILADIIGEVSVIFTDTSFVNTARNGTKLDVVKKLLKDHKAETLHIMALLEGVPVNEYNPSIIELPMSLMSLLNDPDFAQLFHSAETVTASGSATVNTEGEEIV
jgi:hypothetical protein